MFRTTNMLKSKVPNNDDKFKHTVTTEDTRLTPLLTAETSVGLCPGDEGPPSVSVNTLARACEGGTYSTPISEKLFSS